MVKSFRGQDVDMEKLANQQGDTMSLGNTSLNGRGDVVKHGKVTETRAERLKKWLETHSVEQATVNLAEDIESKKLEEEIAKQTFDETKRVAKPKRPFEQKIQPKTEEQKTEEKVEQ